MRGTIVGACVLTFALALTAGCGGDDAKKKAACSQLKTTFTGISTKAMAQTGDPAQLAQAYSSGAQSVRTEGRQAGGKVKKDADKAAGALETLSSQVKNLGDGNPPDTSALVGAINTLQKTCGSQFQ
jgi:hypothetical protein